MSNVALTEGSHSLPPCLPQSARYELLEPLQGLRRDLMQSMGEQQQVAAALLDAAVSARKTGGSVAVACKHVGACRKCGPWWQSHIPALS